jgi:hypothetical protein
MEFLIDCALGACVFAVALGVYWVFTDHKPYTLRD